MEGVTDLPYRLAMVDLFSEWDYFYTDFLRLPSNGTFSVKKIINHMGEEVLSNSKILNKTCFQILAGPLVDLKTHMKILLDAGVVHLDLNLGCPSRKVNRHKGGAYLLSELDLLKKMVFEIRNHFNQCFSVKMRIGYRDDLLFDEVIQTLEQLEVDFITIHGRTRDQLYQGKSDWSYVRKAALTTKIPIIGNGDIWDLDDIDRSFEETGCHSVMLGRGALKTPWIAGLYKENKGRGQVNDAYLLELRKGLILDYFDVLEEKYLQFKKSECFILGRFKQFCRYLFQDFDDDFNYYSLFLQSRSLAQFKNNLKII